MSVDRTLERVLAQVPELSGTADVAELPGGLTNTNYNAFSCTHCHEHNQSRMNSEHQGENGYSWQSSACYNCHPDGQE